MTRYYYRLFDGESVDDRPDGMDLPNLEAARRHAIAVAKDLARNRTTAQNRGWAVGVLDSAGRQLLEVPLADIPND
jgi:hypothetical protein